MKILEQLKQFFKRKQKLFVNKNGTLFKEMRSGYLYRYDIKTEVPVSDSDLRDHFKEIK